MSDFEAYHALTTEELRIMSLTIRIGAALSLICALTLAVKIYRSPTRRQRIFHRIMLGCAFNIILLNLNTIWGPWAVPRDFRDDGFPLASGNQTTCSIQGFLYTMGFVVPSYYVALSMLCYFAIRHKFQVAKYAYIEKYIHVGVYLYPLASGSFLLSEQAYNPGTIDCYLVSLPIGCGDDSPTGQECIRGPDNYAQLVRWLIGLPLGIILLFPTLLFASMYFWLRVAQGPKGARVASSVGRQAGLYLLALHFTYIFRFAYLIMNFKFDYYMFGLHVLGNTVESMQGVWISMAYWYLKSDSSSDGGSENNNNDNNATGLLLVDDDIHTIPSTTTGKMTSMTGEVTVVPLESAKVSSSSSSRNKKGFFKKTSSYFKTSSKEFSIFDGTGDPDPDSPWATYLMDDGEDDDYGENCGEYDDTAFQLNG